MKAVFRRTAAVVLFSVLLPLLLSAAGTPSLAAVGDSSAGRSVVSPSIDLLRTVGQTKGYNSAHGGNQSRMVRVSSGTYFGLLTNKEADGDYGEMSLIAIPNDRSGGRLIKKEQIVYASNQSGSTVTIMADGDENIWVYSGWETADGVLEMVLWFYDVEKDELTEYKERQNRVFGNTFGYSVACMAAAQGRIYCLFGGGDAPGYIAWAVFDLASRTWSHYQVYRTEFRNLYYYAFPDEDSGLIIVCQRAALCWSIPSNVEGMTMFDAMNILHSRNRIGAPYMWDQLYIVHVTDPTAEWKTYVKEGVEMYQINRAVPDVTIGLFPNVNHAWGDCYIDYGKGYLYVKYYSDDNEGIIGRRENIAVFDIRDDFRQLDARELVFVFGRGQQYDSRFYRDTEGNLYLIAVPRYVSTTVEIWRAVNEYGTEYELCYIYSFDPSEPAYYSEDIGGPRLVIANERNGSISSDTASMIVETGDSTDGTWALFDIDFAALRALGSGS